MTLEMGALFRSAWRRFWRGDVKGMLARGQEAVLLDLRSAQAWTCRGGARVDLSPQAGLDDLAIAIHLDGSAALPYVFACAATKRS